MKTENKPISNEEVYTMFENVLADIEQQKKTIEEKLAAIDLKPKINLPAPDMTESNLILENIKSNYENMFNDLVAIKNYVKKYLNDAQLEKRVSLEVGKYKEALDEHCKKTDKSLDRLYDRIPANYDISKRLVWTCI